MTDRIEKSIYQLEIQIDRIEAKMESSMSPEMLHLLEREYRKLSQKLRALEQKIG